MTTDNLSVAKARMKTLVLTHSLAAQSVEQEPKDGEWPKEFINRKRKKIYKPSTKSLHEVLYTDRPRRVLIKGGLGSGKSAAGIIKVLGRLRRGMDGAMLSTDFPHLRKS